MTTRISKSDTHPKVLHGLCAVCGHYGDDCTGEHKPLTLIDLLNKANEGYPDAFLTAYFNDETGEKIDATGDTLAEFIVTELRETFSDDCEREAQIQTAVEALNHAIRDLQATVDALES